VSRWPISDDDARAMYAGGRADDAAKWFAHFWGRVFASGVGPRRWVRLEVPGRRSGRIMSVPIGLADLDRRWYAVSMLGECNWVRNARANDGRVVLRHGRPLPCRLVEVPAAERAPVIRRYVDVAPGGRPHIPVQKGASLSEFESVADRFPVFEIRDEEGRTVHPDRSWFPLAFAGAVLLAAGAARRTALRRRRADG
jgi:hypothetical protein